MEEEEGVADITHLATRAIAARKLSHSLLNAVSCLDKTSQELRMLSSVTLNCQVTKIVMDSGSQLSEL